MGRSTSSGPAANVYLVGFMGSGKSTVGPLLAQALGREYVDLDELIVARSGQSIAEMFASSGEVYFRDEETRCLMQVGRRPGRVVALGGGAILREQNWQIIHATGVSVYLKARPTTVLKRIRAEAARPLLLGYDGHSRLERIRRLMRERRRLYERADLTVANEGTAEEAVEIIAKTLKALWKPSE